MECCKKRKAIANKIVIKARPRRDNANDIKKLLSTFRGYNIGQTLRRTKQKNENWNILLVLLLTMANEI
jgi:hypothetical protein